jgi:hypothetical protein
MLGEAIGKKMLESPEMQEALITIRAELSPHLSHDSDTLQRGNAVDRKNPSGQTSGNGVGVLDAGGLGDQEKTSGPASTP